MCEFGRQIDDFQLRGNRAGIIQDPSKAWVALSGHADSISFQMPVGLRISSAHSNWTYLYVFSLSVKPFSIFKIQGRKAKGENSAWLCFVVKKKKDNMIFFRSNMLLRHLLFWNSQNILRRLKETRSVEIRKSISASSVFIWCLNIHELSEKIPESWRNVRSKEVGEDQGTW